MIRLTATSAVLTLSYPRESLLAAAQAVAGRAEVYVSGPARASRVTLRFAAGLPASARRRAAGDFVNEALSHAYRQRLIRFHAPVTSPVVARLLSRRFPEDRPDPLEAMEPQVAADRAADTAALLQKARSLR